MDSSRLLNSRYSTDDEEFHLDRIHDASSSTRQAAAAAARPERLTRPLFRHHQYQQVATDPHSQQHSDSEQDDDDLEAPASLMLEQTPEDHSPLSTESHHKEQLPRPALSGQTTSSTRQHMTAFDRTMWRWTNVSNMDDFFKRVYDYYQGRGMYCILLARFLNLLTLGFVIGFSTFLIGCVDYAEIPHHHALGEVVIPQCVSRLSGTTTMFLITFVMWWIWQAFRFIMDYPVLKDMHNFYHHLLEIPDKDIQTVPWQTVLQKISDIRETNPNTAQSSPLRLSEHDITSRIMRQENYLIALFNKKTLNITIPLPYLRNMHMFTRDLEWNVSFCVLSYAFKPNGQLRKRFLQDKNRVLLVAGLRRRFIFMGLLNFVFSPFIFVYLIVFFFFRYFEEYHKNPSEIGARSFSPYAKWKFREYNELPHLYRQRLSYSVPIANKYLDQFPKEKTALLARFVAFISGSFAGVLAIVTLFDSEALLNFEISPNGTILFYLGVFGTIFAVSRGMIPDEHLVYEPEPLLRQVLDHIHYFPQEWVGKLHTDEVRAQFCQLFDYKITLFAQELLSVLFTPLVLCFSLPKCAEQIVDSFREYTVHVDGLGYVCSFSQFDFTRHGDARYGAPVQGEDEHMISNDGKMEKSFLTFKANYPTWEPENVEGSMYLSKMTEFQQTRRQRQSHRLNNFGVPEGHEPSKLGDSFARTTNDVVDYTLDEEEEDRQGGMSEKRAGKQRIRPVIGLLNQVYDLNNKNTPM